MHEATANMVLRICLAFQGQCVQSPKILLVGGVLVFGRGLDVVVVVGPDDPLAPLHVY